MANSRSARKRIRANERKHLRNRGVRSAVRTSITKARRALLSTEPSEETADSVLRAVRALDRAAEKGILHRNNADRRKSRLMALAHRLTAAAAGEGDAAAARTAAAGGVKGRGRTTKAKTAASKTATKTASKPAARGAAARATSAARAAAVGSGGAASKTASTAASKSTTTKTASKSTTGKTGTSRTKKS